MEPFASKANAMAQCAEPEEQPATNTMRITGTITISGGLGWKLYTFKDQEATDEDLASLARLGMRTNQRLGPLPHLDLHHDVQSFIEKVSSKQAVDSASQRAAKRRAVSEDPEQVQCAKRRCLDSYYDQTQHDGAMVGNLRHRRRPHKTAAQLKFEREKLPFPVPDQLQLQSLAESHKAAGVDGEILDENNGAVISAKRVKRSAVKVLPSVEIEPEPPSRKSPEPEASAELRSTKETNRGAEEEASATPISGLDGPADADPTSDASDSPGSGLHNLSPISVETIESQSSASTEKLEGKNCDAGKCGSVEQETKADGGAQEQLKPTDTNPVKPGVENKWTRMRAKYNDKKPAAIFPDYGVKLVRPISHSSKSPAKNKKSMKKGIKGGVRPTNTLGNTHFNQKTNKRKDGHGLGGKPFDLKSEAARSQAHLPKKQCVDGVRSGSASSTAPIELESGSTHVSQCRDDSISHSLYGSSQGSPSKNKHSSSKNVSEFSNVESTVKIGQKQKPTTGRQYLQPRPGAKKRTAEALEHEDTDDLIDDSVIITGQQPTPSKGNGYLHPPRSTLNGRKPGNTNKTTGPKSQFFAATSGIQSISKVTPTANDPDCGALEAHGKHMQHQKKLQDQRIAKDLLNKQKSNATKLATARDLEAVGEITDDEEFRKKADIIPTKFGKSRQPMLPEPPRGAKFTIKQFFGVPGRSLTNKDGETWHLIHNKEQRMLIIVDASGQQLPEVLTKTFGTIQYSNQSAKMVLRGSATVQFKQGLIVFLELASSEDSRDLRAELKKGDPTLGESPKEVGHLDKMFTTNSNKKFEPKQKTKPVEVVVQEDIKLAEQNVRRRQQESWFEKQNSKSSYTPPLAHPHKSSGPRKAQGLAKNMQGNVGEEKPSRPSESQTIEPQSFYHVKLKASIADAPVHATRTSSRLAEKDVTPQASGQARSPSPVRWTDLNPHWTRFWKNESISYPQDTKAERRATVDKSDVKRLDDGEFLNDSLIGFYLRYLENNLQKRDPDLAKRVYFQNSHFYESLKGKGGSINYTKVQRWTRKVDLFSKDYIVVPVNENYHWYVAIICNAPLLLGNCHGEAESGDVTIEEIKERKNDVLKLSSLASETAPKGAEGDSEIRRSSLGGSNSSSWPDDNPGDDHVRSLPNIINAPNAAEAGHCPEDSASNAVADKPLAEKAAASGSKKSTSLRKGESLKDRTRIIILDSLSGVHNNTMANLKSYLVEEMKDKKKTYISTSGIKGMNAKNIPTQNNHYDCGPYLLSYVEKFLEKPDEFMSGVFYNQNDLSIKWRNATEMRDHIRDLLFKLQEDFSPPQKLKKKAKLGGEPAAKAAVEPSMAPTPTYQTSSRGTSDMLKVEDTNGAIVEHNTINDVPLFKESVFSPAPSGVKNVEQDPRPVGIYETPVGENKTTSFTHATGGSTPGACPKLSNYQSRSRSPNPYLRHQQSSPDILATAQTSDFTRHDQQDSLEPTSPANLIEPTTNESIQAESGQLSAATNAVDGSDDDEMLLPTEEKRTRQLSSSASITSSENINILGPHVVDLSQDESDEE